MRVIAVIDDPRVTEKILRLLGAWHDPPARLPAPGAPGPYTVDALHQPRQDGAGMNESEKQFSFTRAASSTSGRAKNQIPFS